MNSIPPESQKSTPKPYFEAYHRFHIGLLCTTDNSNTIGSTGLYDLRQLLDSNLNQPFQNKGTSKSPNKWIRTCIYLNIHIRVLKCGLSPKCKGSIKGCASFLVVGGERYSNVAFTLG